MAGLISFPILTRIFSVGDYGILSLVATSIFVIMPFTKLGIHHSSLRYYEECKSGKRIETTSNFYSTLFFGSLLLTLSTIALVWILLKFIPSTLINPGFFPFLVFVAILCFLRSMQGILSVFYRTEQKSITWSIIAVSQRYGTFALGLLFVFYLIKSLYGYYIGVVVADSFVLLFLIHRLFRKAEIHWNYISINFFRESIVYALPLVVVEISSILISFADRYIIQYFLGLETLGIYSASNNIVRYVSQIILIPINLALLPICMKIWVNKGKEETREFLSKALRYFALIAFPITLGLIAIGKNVIVLLASEKYAESYIIIPYVMIGKILLASCNIFNVAWFVYKKTPIYAILMFISFLCNIILNIILIKAFGMIGAAYGTFITYLILFTSISLISFKYLSFKIEFTYLILYFVSSIIMYIVIKNIGHIEYLAVDIVLKIFLGAFVYFALIVIFDSTVRNYLIRYLHGVQATILKS